MRPIERTPLDRQGNVTTPELRQQIYDRLDQAFAAAVDDKAESRIVPPPEIRATELDLSDPRIPGGAQQVIKAALAGGWRLKVTYARGPLMHSSQQTFLRMVDSVLIRGRRLPGEAFGAEWLDNKFDVAYARGLDRPTAKIGANDLKARLKCPVESSSTNDSAAGSTDTI